MLKQQLRIYTVVISAAILVLFNAACGARKPPHYGVFLKQGGSFIEMEQGSGGPPETGVPETSERQPVVVLWVPNVDLSHLVMTEEVGGITRSQVKYILTPKGDDILELKPRGSLSPSMYCLSAGSAFLPASLIPHWCFIVK